jgi:hypothetical protein
MAVQDDLPPERASISPRAKPLVANRFEESALKELSVPLE